VRGFALWVKFYAFLVNNTRLCRLEQVLDLVGMKDWRIPDGLLLALFSAKNRAAWRTRPRGDGRLQSLVIGLMFSMVMRFVVISHGAHLTPHC